MNEPEKEKGTWMGEEGCGEEKRWRGWQGDE